MPIQSFQHLCGIESPAGTSLTILVLNKDPGNPVPVQFTTTGFALQFHHVYTVAEFAKSYRGIVVEKLVGQSDIRTLHGDAARR